jgi:NitT/TauT family transport system substrate-binding protein
MSKISRRDVAIGAAALGAASILRPRGARAATKIRVMTNWFPEAEHGGFFHAVAAGLYEKAGLDVELRPGGAGLNPMQIMAGGEADIVMSYDIQILSSIEKAIPVRAIFTCFQYDLIGLLARSDVNSPAEMKGKKVYFGASGYSTYWPWLKRKYGYTDDMAGTKGSNLQTFITDPTSGVIGYSTSEPYIAQQQNIPAKFFLFGPEGYPTYGNTMATTADFINKDPDAVARFTKASIEGWKAYIQDPSVGNVLIKKMNSKMDDGQINFAIKKMREDKVVDGGDAATMGIGIMTEARWKAIRDFMVEASLLKAETDYNQALNTDFVKNLRITM